MFRPKSMDVRGAIRDMLNNFLLFYFLNMILVDYEHIFQRLPSYSFVLGFLLWIISTNTQMEFDVKFAPLFDSENTSKGEGRKRMCYTFYLTLLVKNSECKENIHTTFKDH